jgi:hypothetical protein
MAAMAGSKATRSLVSFALACGAPAVPEAAVPEAAAPEAAAGTPAAPQAAEAAAPPDATSYPTPYTAEQIRDATRPGRSYTWRLEESGKPPVERTVEFTRVDAEGAELRRDGAARRVTWEELRKHAEFPRALVTTREETVTVPAGTYDCIVYVVNDRAAGETSTFYFAKTMPGAPVLFFTEKAGARLLTNTLVRYTPGAGG